MAAYTQFGYAYPPASQLLVQGGQPTTGASPGASSAGGAGVTASALSPTGSGAAPGALSPASHAPTTPAAPSQSSCCDSGRPIMTDPVSGQTVCSCQYDQARLALSGYPRLSSGAVGVYGAPYPSTDQNPYPSIGVDSSAFYSPLSNPYALKDGSGAGDMSAWTSAGLQPTTGYYPYDPTLAAYGYGAGYDLAARRKNATRESTATLKAWLNEHKKNPYPTKGEKIMLAIITKMTLTQVSTWFANARRRLKKENKMTWEPKNKTDDDDEAMVSDDEKDKDDLIEDKMKGHKDTMHHVKSEHQQHSSKHLDDDDDLTDDERKSDHDMMSHHAHSHAHPMHHHHHHQMLGGYGMKDEMKPGGSDCGVPIPATKPKIWSLADTAACKTPPPPVAQQGWSPHAAAHYQSQMNSVNINNFALPSASMSPSAGGGYGRYSSGQFLGGQYHSVHQGNGQQSCAQVAGFPEVQTDTPPQTPPNMKLASVAGSLVVPHSFGSGGSSSQGSSSSYGSPAPPHHHPLPPHSHPPANAGHYNTHHHANDAAFKPFYKSSTQLTNGFVSPV